MSNLDEKQSNSFPLIHIVLIMYFALHEKPSSFIKRKASGMSSTKNRGLTKPLGPRQVE